jgi:hypothetical protein
MIIEIPARIRLLYDAPFIYQWPGYIFDANHEMVADFGPDVGNPTFRTRGWGRIQYLINAQSLYNSCVAFFGELVQGIKHDPEKCVQRLNDVWENQ